MGVARGPPAAALPGWQLGGKVLKPSRVFALASTEPLLRCDMDTCGTYDYIDMGIWASARSKLGETLFGARLRGQL